MRAGAPRERTRGRGTRTFRSSEAKICTERGGAGEQRVRFGSFRAGASARRALHDYAQQPQKEQPKRRDPRGAVRDGAVVKLNVINLDTARKGEWDGWDGEA